MMNYYQREDAIVWVTDLKELDLPFNSNQAMIPFLFSRYEVMDHTCDKCWKKTLSSRKADEWVAKKLATKKHANCNIEVIENNIAKDLDVDLSNVLGTESNGELWNTKYFKAPRDDYGNKFVPRKDLLTLKANISMIVEITGIELDKNIITKREEPMRLTVLLIKDAQGNTSKLTLFNAELADEFEVGTRLQLVDAQVNMRKQDGRGSSYGESTEYPDGLNVPRWGSLTIFSGEMPTPKPRIVAEVIAPVLEEAVRCEQEHCSKTCLTVGDEQFYCVNCDKELCAICIFEHKTNYSVSGLTCDNEICRGSRGANQ
jgi:hypothetical protein